MSTERRITIELDKPGPHVTMRHPIVLYRDDDGKAFLSRESLLQLIEQLRNWNSINDADRLEVLRKCIRGASQEPIDN